ncbi:MAG: hypothetical protein ACYTF1_17370 [Planctomycetota bacterium]
MPEPITFAFFAIGSVVLMRRRTR